MVEERASGKMLKVAGILMIIGGGLGIILSIVTLGASAALSALLGDEASLGLLYAAGILTLLSAAVSLVAGILGVKYCRYPQKAGKCMLWGILAIILTVAGQVFSLVAGNQFNFMSLLLGLVLPIIYIVGVVQAKKAIS